MSAVQDINFVEVGHICQDLSNYSHDLYSSCHFASQYSDEDRQKDMADFLKVVDCFNAFVKRESDCVEFAAKAQFISQALIAFIASPGEDETFRALKDAIKDLMALFHLY